MKWFLKRNAKPKEIHAGLITSINAAYTKKEIAGILSKTHLKNAIVSENMIGIVIKGIK